MKLLATFVLSALALCSADVVIEGVCPELMAVENFNVTAYSGLWYEISKYPSDAETGGTCATAEYTLTPETSAPADASTADQVTNAPTATDDTIVAKNCSGDEVRILVRNTHVISNVQAKLEGSARLAPDANGTARILVTFKFGDVTKESPLWILGTDYNNYAVAFTCKYNEKSNNHKINAWLLSRTKTLGGEAKTAVDNVIKTVSDLDPAKFIQTDFSEKACKFDKSTVITELPKAQ